MRALLGQLSRNEEGMALIEFGFAAPVLVALVMGSFELGRMLLVHQKTEKVAYTVSDVVTQSTSVTNAQLANIVTAASEIMQPFAFGANGVVIITSVYQNGVDVPPTVRWRYTGGGTLSRPSLIGAVNSNATLPGGLQLNDRDNVIVAEIYYQTSAFFPVDSWATQEIYKTAIFKPRLGVLTTPPT